MPEIFRKSLLLAACTLSMVVSAPYAYAVDQGTVVSDRVKKLTRAIKWTPVAAIPINFNTYHPQGMVKIGDTFFLSAVPVELWTESGLPMTYNPFWIEPTANGLRAYFVPEDEKSTLYVYEAEVK